MKYYAGGLSTGLHNLTVANADLTSQWFDLDMVNISNWSSMDPAGTFVATPTLTEASTPVSSTISTSPTPILQDTGYEL